MKEKRTGIYAIVNIWNGNQYIGSSVDLARRKKVHFALLRKDKHHSPHMQYAYNKYGKSAFEFRVILYCEPGALLYYEQKLLDLRVPVYNVSPTAGSCRGHKHTAEARRNMSKAASRRTTPEYRDKIRNAAKNRKPISDETRARQSEAAKRLWTPEYRDRMSEAAKHRPPLSKEHRAKLSAALRGKGKSEETRAKMRAAQRNRKSMPPVSEETRAKMSAAQKVRAPDSPETRARKSAAVKLWRAQRRGEAAE
jgi:group I intron endonuclease